jgi:predicted phage tail protein
MLRKIKLYGPLAKFIGQRILEADVATAAEAMRFLLANWPELEQHMAQHFYRVVVGDDDLPVDTDPEQLHYPVGLSEIKIIPVVAGAGAAGRIIAGVALVAASLLFAPGAALASSAFTLGPMAASIGTGIGLSLTLGGVAQLLMPMPTIPDADSASDPRRSYSFSGIQNTSRQGVPVPIIYGETLIGSVVISAGIDIVQVSA